jgi:uncharacterized cofD-like protein
MTHAPKIVAIGGGHGLASLLRGLKQHTTNITAIVTVADDGGSSGKLRRELGTLPPGDFRMCISALANDESLVTQLFQYRFGAGSGLSGHSFGNLFIVAMKELTGSFERAVLESSKVLASAGRILPSTLTDVTLCAEFSDGAGAAKGESSIGKIGAPIERVWLEPNSPPAFPEAVRAILDADIVVLGPGSLYTSVLPNLLVPDITQALRHSNAPCVYVCNVATEVGETDNFGMWDFVTALEQHIGRGIIDAVIANNKSTDAVELPSGVRLIYAESDPRVSNGTSPMVIAADVVDELLPWRHDSQKLANTLLKNTQSFSDKNTLTAILGTS